jgi:GntR family transcriptional regulator, gluconate operon transcriptional repressor
MRPLQTHKSLAENAADQIRREILRGGFTQGERLVEAHIARQLGISRGPVREALKLLRVEGLVEEEPRRGSLVVILSAGDVREIYDLRIAIEARAVKLLARETHPGDLTELHHLQERLEEALAAGAPREAARADLAFHETICRLSGNRRLHAVFTRHMAALHALFQLDERLYGSLDEILIQHRPLLAAIECGDPQLACSRLEEHVEQARDLVAAYIETLPAQGRPS